MSDQSKGSFWISCSNLPMWQKILFAMVAGTFAGLLLGPKANCLKPIGSLFINAIRMLIVPVIFTASVCAVLSMSDFRKMRRVGIKTFSIYFISMAVAAAIGLIVASIIIPGKGLSLPAQEVTTKISTMPSWGEIISGLIPSNPISAFVEGNILQMLVLALLLGISINSLGEKGQCAKNFFKNALPVVFKLTSTVISFAPYGVFSLMACAAGEYGMATMLPLLKLIMAAYVSDILLFVLFYCPGLVFISRTNPLHFFKNISEALLFAFSSSSGAATLPISLRCAENNLGINKQLAGFLLPLGVSFNMNGLAIYVSIATIFTANIYGVHLGLAQYAILITTIVFTSMGAAGIPGSALIVMGAAMTAVGLPLGAIPLIAGVDRIIDMAQTTTNVAGDLFSAHLVSASEKEMTSEDVATQANDINQKVTL